MPIFKKYLTIAWLSLGFIFPLSLNAKEGITPLEHLMAMNQAHKQRNFEILYFLQQGSEFESLRYRHAVNNQLQVAQLMRLDNAREEIILRDGTVSYLGYEFKPFSLKTDQILDGLPSVFYTNFAALTDYHFVEIGKTRIADRMARVIRIVPKDDLRYQYTVWIDEENSLLLRSELLDKQNNVLEQFRVIQQYADDQMTYIIEPIMSLVLPKVTQNNSIAEKTQQIWQPNWLPSGFKAVANASPHFSNTLADEKIESRLYSDGLFSFTLYFVPDDKMIADEQFWQQGTLTVYTQSFEQGNMVLIGDIPLTTAQKIVKNIQFK